MEKRLRVLAVGNSFSVDAMQWLAELAAAAGIEEVCLGNLYIGGCTLAQHAANARSGAAAYTYFKNTGAGWTEREASISDGLADEEWDFLTLQQASAFSGLAESYNEDLTALIAFLQKGCPNPAARLYWLMTWAYAKDSDHPGFANYGHDQAAMYRAICGAVQEKILPLSAFSGVIPAGTVIQSLRALLGDRLTRDGFHLDLGLGRYAAGMAWLRTLTGADPRQIDWRPEGVTDAEVEAVRRAVLAAEAAPFSAIAPAGK